MSYFKIPEILLPKKEYDYSKWATIACDQFTSQPDYWESLKYFVGDNKSTLNLVFPEVYLETVDKEAEVKDMEGRLSYIEKLLFEIDNKEETREDILRHFSQQ